MDGTPCHITVAGRMDDPNFQVDRKVAQSLSDMFVPVTCEIIPMVETEWEDYYKEKKEFLSKQSGKTGERNNFRDVLKHKLSPIIFYNGVHYIPNLLSWANKMYDYMERPKMPLYKNLARNTYNKWMADNPNTFIYMDISVGKQAPSSRVVFELYTNVCPKTSENFRALCCNVDGPSYLGSIFHRVVPGGWVQGGDIDGSHGDGGSSIYGDTFADESFSVKHDTSGILAMAGRLDEPHSNGSQFYVTLGKQPWLDCKRVAFGRVISGMRVFRIIEKSSTSNQRPNVECKVVKCGELIATVNEKIEDVKIRDAGLDLRRPKTKLKLLQLLYETIDSSGDGMLSKGECVKALEKDMDIVKNLFPKHSHCMSDFFRTLDKNQDQSISMEEFLDEGMKMLSSRAI